MQVLFSNFLMNFSKIYRNKNYTSKIVYNSHLFSVFLNILQIIPIIIEIKITITYKADAFLICDFVTNQLKDNNKIDSHTYYYYLASLINSIDKYANTASVYGAFLKKIKKSAQKDFKLELLPVINGTAGKAYNQDINRLIRDIKGDVLYLDPPYNSRQYCSNYHVLETIARYDNPVLSGKTGLRDSSDQKSLFCSKRTVCNAFDDLIRHSDFKYIFLSYNNEGLMSLDTIKDIMSQYGKYSFYTKEYKRFKADKETNRNIAASSTTEYLHCLIKQ